MLLSEKHIKQFACFYLLCFLLNFGWFWWNGLLFSSLDPVFFFNSLDFTRNILMLSNLQHALLNNRWLRVTFDVIYLLLPLILTLAVLLNFKIKKGIAFITIGFTIVYAIFFSSVSYISMQGYMSWILIPLILSSTTIQGFYYYLHVVRIIFILMFVAAAVQKLYSGAIFNTDQMSGILLKQHAVYLVSNAEDWFTKFIYFLVQHKITAFAFYIMGTLAELILVIGLFTRRYDRILLVVFCAFLFADYFLMQIYYFIWLAFTGCFYFSYFSLDDKMEYKKLL